jgi:3-polyprenyl-4-hydroxybenzoate decarboxylase
MGLPVIVAISGASGAIYGVRILEELKMAGIARLSGRLR